MTLGQPDPSAIDLSPTPHGARLAKGVRPVRIIPALEGVEPEVPPGLGTEVGRTPGELGRAQSCFRPHDLALGLDAGGGRRLPTGMGTPLCALTVL